MYWLWVGVEFVRLDFWYDFCANAEKQLIHFLTCLGRSFEEHKTVHIGELFALIVTHLSPIFGIDFVADEDNQHFVVAVVFDFVKPSVDVFEGVPLCDIVD
jgi:hypothetical protein